MLRRGMSKVAVYRDEPRQRARAVGRLPASGRHRALECGGNDVGLPVPRLAVRPAGQSD